MFGIQLINIFDQPIAHVFLKRVFYLNFLLKRNLLNSTDNMSYHLNELYNTAIWSVLHVK